MKYIAAYMLAVLAGKAEPTADDVKAILKSVDASVEDEKLNSLLEALKGKNLEELIAAGKEKMSTVSVCAAPAAAAGSAPAAAAEAAPAEEKKEEKKEEEEEEDMDMGGLFD